MLGYQHTLDLSCSSLARRLDHSKDLSGRVYTICINGFPLPLHVNRHDLDRFNSIDEATRALTVEQTRIYTRTAVKLALVQAS